MFVSCVFLRLEVWGCDLRQIIKILIVYIMFLPSTFIDIWKMTRGLHWARTRAACSPWAASCPYLVYTDYLHSPCTVTTHGLVACQVSDVLFCLQLLRYCLGLRVCCCNGCSRCCPPCADRRGPFPLHVFCPQLLCQLLEEFLPGFPATGALLEDVGIDHSQAEDIIEDCHYPSSRTAIRDRNTPLHLVQDVLTVLAVVVVHHRLSFGLRPTKGAHTCVHGALDADILLRLSLVHNQSCITSAPLCWTAQNRTQKERPL